MCAVWEDDGRGGHKMVHLLEALRVVGEVTLALTRRVAVPHDDQLSHEVVEAA